MLLESPWGKNNTGTSVRVAVLSVTVFDRFLFSFWVVKQNFFKNLIYFTWICLFGDFSLKVPWDLSPSNHQASKFWVDASENSLPGLDSASLLQKPATKAWVPEGTSPPQDVPGRK